MASIEGGQHKRPATPIPCRLQLFRLGSVHLFFFACAFARSSALLLSSCCFSSFPFAPSIVSSIRFFLLFFFFCFFCSLPFLFYFFTCFAYSGLVSLSFSRFSPPFFYRFSLLFFLTLSTPTFIHRTHVKCRSPFPRQCSFISLTPCRARCIKIDHCYRRQRGVAR